MARRPRDADDDVSLFPFLSIIACVIGVLTMMISTLALAQMDTKDVAVIEAHENATRDVTAAEEEIAKFKKMLDEKLGPDAASMRQEKTASEKELAALAADLKKIQKELEEQKQVKIVIPTIDAAQRESVASMQTQFADLTAELAQLTKDLSERKASSESKVSILPGGSGVNFTPHFVECAADSLVIHAINPPNDFEPVRWSRTRTFSRFWNESQTGPMIRSYSWFAVTGSIPTTQLANFVMIAKSATANSQLSELVESILANSRRARKRRRINHETTQTR